MFKLPIFTCKYKRKFHIKRIRVQNEKSMEWTNDYYNKIFDWSYVLKGACKVFQFSCKFL